MNPIDPIKAYLALAVLLVIVVVQTCLCVHFYRDGEARVRASDAAAVEKMRRAAQAQKEVDDALYASTIKSLQQQLAAAGAVAATPAPHMRLCVPTRYAGPVSAPGAPASGAQPAKPADSSGDTGVREGTGAGPDIGPGVRDLALAGAILATYRDRTYDWAVEQAHAPPH
jgi:hypothetical protein